MTISTDIKKWTSNMERLINIYYPRFGINVTMAVLKDRIPDYSFSRKELQQKIKHDKNKNMHRH
jgi:hypothetical protein